MKRILLTLLLAFALCSAAYAAEQAPVRVAVIDTGISAAAVSSERIAAGYNYIRPQDGTEDLLGHGTAVSAIIAGSEKAHITGVCPTAELVPLVYCSLDESGAIVKGDTAMTAQAIYDAVDTYGCRIINLSSGSTSDSASLKNAVEYAAERGVLVVSCAGNSGLSDPALVYYPGAYDSVLCVGAANQDGTRAEFSQNNEFVDILARGTDLVISSAKGTRIRGEGTSYATAIVSGAAAAVMTKNPSLTAAQVRRVLLETAHPVDGNLVLNLEAALAWSPEGAHFADVAADDWFYEAVKYADENGLFAGTSETTFSPNAPMTRQMLWTVLSRLDGQTLTGSGVFDRAKAWAVEKGVTDGENAGEAITREQLITILWRYAGSPMLMDYPGLAQYSDAGDIAAYAQQAMVWAHQKGIISGDSATTLKPSGTATRAQVAAIVMRYAQSAAK